jgi:hypothetical protein
MSKSWYLIEELPELITKTFFIAHLIFTDDREQMTEDRRQKAEDRRQNERSDICVTLSYLDKKYSTVDIVFGFI